MFILSRDVPGQRSLSLEFCSCPCPGTKGQRDVPFLGNPSPKSKQCFRYDLNLSDTNDLQSEFGLSMEDVWYFAPRLQEFLPYDVVICLIWTSPFTGARNPDWSDDVSKPKFKKFKIQILIS